MVTFIVLQAKTNFSYSRRQMERLILTDEHDEAYVAE